MLVKLQKAIRTSNWWNYKLPPLFGIAFLMIYVQGLSFPASWPVLSALLVWMIGAAGFGHYTNDIFDIEADKAAGKPNAAAGHTIIQRVIIISALAIVALVPWLFLDRSGLIIPLTLLQFLLFLLYAAPPVRLKNRGFSGILADAVYAHLIPSMVVIAAFAGPDKLSDFISLVIAVLAWQFFWGLRNILMHQLQDQIHDAKASAKTFILSRGETFARRFILWFILPVEFLGFLAMCLNDKVTALGILLPLLAFFIIKSLQFKKDKRTFREGWMDYMNSFLSNFYEQVFPLCTVLIITINNDLSFLAVGLVFVILFRAGIQQLFRDLQYALLR